jgi:transketolase
MINLFDCRVEFSTTVTDLVENGLNLVVVTNDAISSSGLQDFAIKYPARVLNVGIAEQNMVGIASGLAKSGVIPLVCSASCFLCARAFEQIKVDVAYSGENVKMFGFSPGFSYAALGPTHHSPEDISLVRCLEGIRISTPSDPDETRYFVMDSIISSGPTFTRILRTPVARIYNDCHKFSYGKANEVCEGSDLVFFTMGSMAHHVLSARSKLMNRGISSSVVISNSIYPFDEEILFLKASQHKGIVVVEDCHPSGGLSSIISQLLCRELPRRVLSIAPDGFAPVGSLEYILRHFGMDDISIADRAEEFVRHL